MNYLKTLLCAILAAAVLCGCGQGSQTPAGDFTSVPTDTSSVTENKNVTEAMVYRAMWISYLDWASLDTTNADTFTQSVSTMYDNCVGLGLNCVIVQVRPFCDAIYPSEYFPWSNLLAGTQGQDPGYDPLAILVEQAHLRGLAFEAWINPYRIRLSEQQPAELAEDSPALAHPEWVKTMEDGGMYFDPSLAEVQSLIVSGVTEIVTNYDVDGIQFDDYFYPTTDASFDEEEYSARSGGQELAAWRRNNVNTLVRTVYSAVKAANPNCVFGISPQGNNDNNYNGQYSDVKLWLSDPGYVDYIMPQIYWGFGYTMSNGSTQYAFENCVAEWAAMPRHPSVSLAIGVGAYRIGKGDGGQNDQSQWESGHNLSDSVKALAQVDGVRGFALYRYANLYPNSEYPELAVQEQSALRATLTQGAG